METFNAFFIFILGLSIGSFLNVLIDRLPKERSIMGRSACDFCHHELTWFDLVPVISFFCLGRRCRYCRKKLSWQYPVVEMLTGAVFLSLYICVPANPINRGIYLALASSLIVIFLSDAKYRIIPDSMQLTFFISVLLLKFFDKNIIISLIYGFRDSLIVMAPILFIYLFTKGRGMGFGDVKLSFTIGFFLGILKGFMALYSAFVLGAIVGIILIAIKKKRLKSKVAFGPFLVLGVIITCIWQRELAKMIFYFYGFK